MKPDICLPSEKLYLFAHYECIVLKRDWVFNVKSMGVLNPAWTNRSVFGRGMLRGRNFFWRARRERCPGREEPVFNRPPNCGQRPHLSATAAPFRHQHLQHGHNLRANQLNNSYLIRSICYIIAFLTSSRVHLWKKAMKTFALQLPFESNSKTKWTSNPKKYEIKVDTLNTLQEWKQIFVSWIQTLKRN